MCPLQKALGKVLARTQNSYGRTLREFGKRRKNKMPAGANAKMQTMTRQTFRGIAKKRRMALILQTLLEGPLDPEIRHSRPGRRNRSIGRSTTHLSLQSTRP